jgi:hypothetical protein
MQEVSKMSDAVLTMDKVLEEAGLIAKWEARAEARKELEIARKMKARGTPLDYIAEDTGLPLEKIAEL